MERQPTAQNRLVGIANGATIRTPPTEWSVIGRRNQSQMANLGLNGAP